jgi:hypothetical protein
LGADKALPNLEESSLIIMGNVSYHIVLEKPPIQSWRWDVITAWLRGKGIPFAEGSFKAELLNLATAYKSPRKR